MAAIALFVVTKDFIVSDRCGVVKSWGIGYWVLGIEELRHYGIVSEVNYVVLQHDREQGIQGACSMSVQDMVRAFLFQSTEQLYWGGGRGIG